MAGAVLLGAGLLVAPPAQAATCGYASCAQQDPQSTGCSVGAYDIGYPQDGTMAYAIRWSPTCQTAWLRATWDQVAIRNAGSWGKTLRTYTSSYQLVWQINVGSSAGCNSDFCWTPMIPMTSDMLINVSTAVPGYYNTAPA